MPALALDYEAANPTSVRVLVIASKLTLCWWTADETPTFDPADLKDRPNCSWYRPIAAEAWVSPASSVKHAQSFAIPIDHPQVTITARIAFARGDRLRTSDDVVRKEKLGPCRDVKALRLEEESRIKALAQDRKYLVDADENGDGGLNFDFDAGPDLDCPSHDPSNLAEYFGTTEQKQVLSVWLTPPKPD